MSKVRVQPLGTTAWLPFPTTSCLLQGPYLVSVHVDGVPMVTPEPWQGSRLSASTEAEVCSIARLQIALALVRAELKATTACLAVLGEEVVSSNR